MMDFKLTDEQIKALRLEHRAAKDRIYAYKINAVILLGTGWLASLIIPNFQELDWCTKISA
jgi:hypothetical protein